MFIKNCPLKKKPFKKIKNECKGCGASSMFFAKIWRHFNLIDMNQEKFQIGLIWFICLYCFEVQYQGHHFAL